MDTHSTQITRHIKAPRQKVYRALLDVEKLPLWKVPDGMMMQVHEFEGRVGGAFRISLTYDGPNETGKTTAQTDTYHGRYVELIPDTKIVEEDEFETSDPALQGVMTISMTLTDRDGGADLVAVHDGLPKGVSAADNQLGWEMALKKLAALVEAEPF